jgi:hypothetical protein
LLQIRAYAAVQVEKARLSTENLMLSSGFEVQESWLEEDGVTLTEDGTSALATFIMQEVKIKRYKLS